MTHLRPCVVLALAVTFLGTAAFAGDQEVAEQVAAHLQKGGKVTNYRIVIHFRDGAVTLHGTMSSQEQIDLAVRLAGEVKGVRKVVNELKVTPESAKAGEAIPADLPAMEDVAADELTRADGKDSIRVAFLAPFGATIIRSDGDRRDSESERMICPAHCNLPEGGVCQFRIVKLPQYPGAELLMTLEIKPRTPETKPFLHDKDIPITFSEDDIPDVLAGKLAINVVYLPDEEAKKKMLVAVETLTSLRIDAETDPIAEADRRGAILAIVRLKRGTNAATLPAR